SYCTARSTGRPLRRAFATSSRGLPKAITVMVLSSLPSRWTSEPCITAYLPFLPSRVETEPGVTVAVKIGEKRRAGAFEVVVMMSFLEFSSSGLRTPIFWNFIVGRGLGRSVGDWSEKTRRGG